MPLSRASKADRSLPLPLLAVLGLASLLVAGSAMLGHVGAASADLPLMRPMTEVPGTAQRVEIGIYPITIYDLDQTANTFFADAYVFFRWKGDRDPTASLELVNAVDESDMTRISIYDKPQATPDGGFFQMQRLEGRFFQPFMFDRFPLDEHRLSILVEDSTYTSDQLVYIPDEKISGLGELLKIPGWNIKGWKMTSLERSYPNNGDPNTGDAPIVNFSHMAFEITIMRPISYFAWKLYLPLVIAMSLTWSALLLYPQNLEARAPLPATGLLTAVFLQLGYAATLPEVGRLVLLDKIYVMAYALIAIVLAEVIATGRWTRGEPDAKLVARAHRLDRVVLVAQIIVFFGGTALLITFG